jgi:RNA polymerase sigma factor (sigma-70 family)
MAARRIDLPQQLDMKQGSPVASYSDEDLIQGIRNNDQRFLGIVYKRNFQSILHFVLQNNGSEQEAKDIYQEAVMIFYEKLQQENFLLTCQIKTFIYSICRRLWLKRLREKGRLVGKIDDHEEFLIFEEEHTDIEEKEQQFAQMAAALEQLGEPCSTILKDYYIEEYSMQQIAEKMGYTNADNAKNQKYKCLMRLKKIFFKAESV